jgi:hypothetical protein
MAVTMDFEDWLDTIDLKTEAEQQDLINSVQNVTDAGEFSTTRIGDRFFVKSWTGDTKLLLSTDNVRLAFVAKVMKVKVLDDLEEGYQRNMNNTRS